MSSSQGHLTGSPAPAGLGGPGGPGSPAGPVPVGGTPGSARKKRGPSVLSSHVGSLVGSTGRQSFADFMSPRADEVRLALDGLARAQSPALAPAGDAGCAIDDGDGSVLGAGLRAPRERDRLLREREDLLLDNKLLDRRLSHGGRFDAPSSRSRPSSGYGYGALLNGDDASAAAAAAIAGSPAPVPEAGELGPDGHVRTAAEDLEEAWEAAVLAGPLRTKVSRELRVVLVNTVPLAVTFFLQYSLVVASIFSVGHLGKKELGAVSLGSMTASITGFALIQGLATCLDTLCAQAYGAGRPDLVGLYFQKCVVMTMLCLIPVWLLWVRADVLLEPILPEDEWELIPLARQYLRLVGIGIPGYTLFECGKRFLQAQGIFHASTLVLVVVAPVNIVLNYALVWSTKFGIGFSGAPLAVAISDWLMALLLGLYVIFIDGKECWNGFTWAVFSDWSPLIRLAVPGVLMVESEFWAFEMLTLASSRFGTAALAAQSVLSTCVTLAYQVPFALSIAASTRIANFVGAGLKEPAVLATEVTMVTSVVLSLIDGILLYSLRWQLGSLFTNDRDVLELAVNAFAGCATLHVFDGVDAVMGGVLRGQGEQRIGGYLNLMAYYVLGVPCAMLFAFKFNWGLEGLWAGIAVGLIGLAIVAFWVISRTDWDKVIERSRRYLV